MGSVKKVGSAYSLNSQPCMGKQKHGVTQDHPAFSGGLAAHLVGMGQGIGAATGELPAAQAAACHGQPAELMGSLACFSSLGPKSKLGGVCGVKREK